MAIKLQNVNLVTAIIIMVNIKFGTGQTHTLQPVIVKQAGNGGCPTQQQREDTLQALRNNISDILSQYSTVPECGEGLWYRVAYLNMTDPTQECPPAWRLYNTTSGVRACGRPVTSTQSHPATFYPSGRQYSRVCGRVIGYQVASPGAFHIVHITPLPSSLDDTYVDGVSVTHGHPRQHIWTFAAGATEGTYPYGPQPDCPCSRAGATTAPSYIGNNYYCESGTRVTNASGRFFSSDRLWDGEQCEEQCCSEGKTPPWFKVNLSSPTSDDIEVRICGDESTINEDTPIELIEIYVA